MTTLTLGGRTYIVNGEGTLAPVPQGDGSMVSAAPPEKPGFFSRERGQARTAALGKAIEHYTPPELRQRLGLLNEFLNPVVSAENSMRASGEMFAPGRTPMQRLGSAAEMATGMAEMGMAGYGGLAAGLSRRGVPTTGQAAAVLADTGDAARGSYRINEPLRVSDGSYAAGNGRPDAVAIPGQGRFDARPVGPIEEAAREYMAQRGIPEFGPLGKYPDFDEDRASAIGAAYDAMKHAPNDPLVRRAYDAMIGETLDQYNALKGTGIDFKFLKEGMSDPYARSPSLGYKDMIENGRLWVFPTDFGFGSSSAFDPSTNPLLKGVGRIGDKDNAVANDAFRVVHDAFGHYGPGNPFFRHQGEERAWVEHSRMFSPEARGAMTSETRGQNSWLNFGPHGAANRSASGSDTIFADQKTGLLPEWMWYAGGAK